MILDSNLLHWSSQKTDIDRKWQRKAWKFEGVKVWRMEKKVYSAAIISTSRNTNLTWGNRNQKFTMKEAEIIADKFCWKWLYPVRLGCCSSPTLHLCTSPSEHGWGIPTPPERSLRPRPWKSPTTATTNPFNIHDNMVMILRSKEERWRRAWNEGDDTINNRPWLETITLVISEGMRCLNQGINTLLEHVYSHRQNILGRTGEFHYPESSRNKKGRITAIFQLKELLYTATQHIFKFSTNNK